MAHMRKQIRDAVVSRLTNLPTAAARVFGAKRWNWQGGELPGIAVYTDSETAQRRSADGDQERRVDLIIDCAASASDELEDALDQMCAEVEAAMATDSTFGGLAWDSTYAGMTTDASTDGEKPVGIKRLRYSVTYETAEGAPEAVI